MLDVKDEQCELGKGFLGAQVGNCQWHTAPWTAKDPSQKNQREEDMYARSLHCFCVPPHSTFYSLDLVHINPTSNPAGVWPWLTPGTLHHTVILMYKPAVSRPSYPSESSSTPR